MWPQCLLPSLDSICLRIQEQILFSDGVQTAILDSQTERFKQFWISMSLRCFPSSFHSIQLTVWEEMSFEELLRWPPWQPSQISERNNFSNSESLCRSNASYQVLDQTNLRFGRRCPLKNFKMASMTAILGFGTKRFWQFGISITFLCVPSFWLNPTYGSGGDVVWRISRWPPWGPSWILEWKDFCISESLCHCDASHQVFSQSDVRFGRRCRLKNFKLVDIFDIGTTILAILNFYVAPIPPIKFWLNLTYGLGGDSVWRISRWLPQWPSWIWEQNDLSNSESLCHCDASHQVLAQSDLRLGGDVILDIGMEQF